MKDTTVVQHTRKDKRIVWTERYSRDINTTTVTHRKIIIQEIDHIATY